MPALTQASRRRVTRSLTLPSYSPKTSFCIVPECLIRPGSAIVAAM